MSAVKKKKNTNWSRKLLLCVSAGVDCWENPRGAVSYDHFRISVFVLLFLIYFYPDLFMPRGRTTDADFARDFTL